MIETLVTFSETALRTLVNDLSLTSGRVRACPAGLSRLAGRLEFLVHRAAASEPRPSGDAPRVVVLQESRPELLGRRLDDASFFPPAGVAAAVVALGVGPAAGRVAGIVRIGENLLPLCQVRLAGAGLPAVALNGAAKVLGEETSPWPWPEEEVLSRTIGALGEAAWRRLRGLRVALVGCGRTGSLLAVGLRKLGVRRLALLDPDRLEPHNLGEMDAVGPEHVGRPKAEALAEALGGAARVAWLRMLTPVFESVLSMPALLALKPADVLVCCADDGSARLATALLATLYLKPLLDIGTGVLHGRGPEDRRLGADVRLLLPGRCLLCLGGVADLDAARRSLRHARPTQPAEDWRRTRRGSLRSLNSVAVGLGLRLLEELIAGHRIESTWLHLECDATGLPALEQRRSPSPSACPACALTGAGDAGLSELSRLLESSI